MSRREHPQVSAPAQPVSTHSRFLAAWWGAFIGDALAMPAHGYYNRARIARDYGTIDGYLAPRNPHPDSILWRSHYHPTGEKDDILHDQAQYWGKPGIHYHQFLQAGENTLNLKISVLLAESLAENGIYDPDDFVRRYTAFMLDPDAHNDTYIDEYHRGFFRNYARGKPPEQCGVEDIDISCLTALTPLVLFHRDNGDALSRDLRRHLKFSHLGENPARAGEFYGALLHQLLAGHSVESALFERLGRSSHHALSFPLRRWVQNHTDEEVVGKLVSSACYLEDALPAALYLALKYDGDFETALTRNTALGGDNCHRGAVLGAILGASCGCEGIPEEWVGGLVEQERYDALGDALWEASG